MHTRCFIQRAAHSVIVLSAMALVGCTRTQTPESLTANQTDSVSNAVRTFAATVANDVTRKGPAAWGDKFSDTFFMAAEGHLVFANNADARRGIEKLTGTIAHIELRWGDSMHVDPLTPRLAMVGMPYHEVRIDTAGQKVEESGYFTGLAELGASGWRFRNAHWSVAGPPSSVP